MTIGNIKNKWWYRFIQVIYLFLFIIIAIGIGVFVYQNNIPYKQLDLNKSTFTCLQGGNEGKNFSFQEEGITSYENLNTLYDSYNEPNSILESCMTPTNTLAISLTILQYRENIITLINAGATSSSLSLYTDNYQYNNSYNGYLLIPSKIFSEYYSYDTVGSWIINIILIILYEFLLVIGFFIIRTTFFYIIIGNYVPF